MYNNRRTRQRQAMTHTSNKSNYVIGVGIVVFAIVANIIIASQPYQYLIVSLS